MIRARFDDIRSEKGPPRLDCERMLGRPTPVLLLLLLLPLPPPPMTECLSAQGMDIW